MLLTAIHIKVQVHDIFIIYLKFHNVIFVYYKTSHTKLFSTHLKTKKKKFPAKNHFDFDWALPTLWSLA